MSIQTQKERTWQDFATVKRWKTRLAINSVNQELSVHSWKCACAWFPQFLKLTGKTPDELIAEEEAKVAEAEAKAQEEIQKELNVLCEKIKKKLILL